MLIIAGATALNQERWTQSLFLGMEKQRWTDNKCIGKHIPGSRWYEKTGVVTAAGTQCSVLGDAASLGSFSPQWSAKFSISLCHIPTQISPLPPGEHEQTLTAFQILHNLPSSFVPLPTSSSTQNVPGHTSYDLMYSFIPPYIHPSRRCLSGCLYVLQTWWRI